MELEAVDSSPSGSMDRLSCCFISVLFYFFSVVYFVDYDMRLMRVSNNWTKIKNSKWKDPKLHAWTFRLKQFILTSSLSPFNRINTINVGMLTTATSRNHAKVRIFWMKIVQSFCKQAWRNKKHQGPYYINFRHLKWNN